jgi:hypothetical protein
MVLRLLVTASYSLGISSATTLKIDSNRDVDGTTDGFILRPQDDYWITEVVAWESQAWAAMQVTIADFAVGAIVRPVQITNDLHRVTPDDTKELCGAQKIRKSGDIV